MTTKKGAPADLSPDDVLDLLRQQLGDTVALQFISCKSFARLINDANRTGQLPSRGSWTVAPHVAEVREAVRTLSKALPRILQEGDALLAELRAPRRNAASQAEESVEAEVQLYRNLAEAVAAVAAGLPAPRREADIRSAWHPTARLFATFIEQGYEDAGVEEPTRRSQSSPLVLAVRCLLAQIGEKHDPDAIRKALTPADARPGAKSRWTGK